MTLNNISLDENIRNNFVLWIAMLIGQLFFAAISIYLVTSGAMKVDQLDLSKILLYIVPIIAIASVFTSNYIFKQRLNALKDQTDLNTKFVDYRSALIIRWALIEGPSFFAIISYLLTGNLILLGVGVILIIIFILFMPNRSNAEADLEISWQDKNELMK